MSDTPIVDRCAERGSDLGLANEAWSRIWPTARDIERHANAMAEVLLSPHFDLRHEALAAWSAFKKENSR